MYTLFIPFQKLGNSLFFVYSTLIGFSWRMDCNTRLSGQCWIVEFEIGKPRQVVPRSRNLSEDSQSWRIRRQRNRCTRQCSILRSSQTLTKVAFCYLILAHLSNAPFIRFCLSSLMVKILLSLYLHREQKSSSASALGHSFIFTLLLGILGVIFTAS